MKHRWVAFSSRSYSHRIISVVSSSRLFSPKQTNSSGRMRNYVSASLEGCSRADRRCLRARRSACGDDCPPCAISSPGVGDAESSYCLIQSQLRTKERREALCCAFIGGPRCPHARVSAVRRVVRKGDASIAPLAERPTIPCLRKSVSSVVRPCYCARRWVADQRGPRRHEWRPRFAGQGRDCESLARRQPPGMHCSCRGSVPVTPARRHRG